MLIVPVRLLRRLLPVMLLALGIGAPLRAPAIDQAPPRQALDSLLRAIRRPRPVDTLLLNDYHEAVYQFTLVNSDSAAALAATEERLARRVGHPPHLLAALAQRGQIFYNNSDFLAAGRLAQELIRRTDHAPPAQLRYRARAYKLLGHVYAQQQQRAQATTYLRQALAMVERTPSDSLTRRSVYSSLVQFYSSQIYHGDHSDSTARQTRYFSRRLMTLARAKRLQGVMVSALQGLALSQLDQQPDTAAAILRRSIVLALNGNSPDAAANGRHLLMLHELKRRHWAAAAAVAQDAIRAGEAFGTRDEDAYDVLAQARAATGQWQQAYGALRTFGALRDSIYSTERDGTLAKLQAEFDTERKERRIRELSQQQQLQATENARQRQRLVALAAVLVAVLVGLGVAAFLYDRLRRSQIQLAAQNAELAAQRNTLAAQRDELTQARATQDRLYALIAHDLRSPVVAFTGLADLLNRYVTRNDTARLAGLGGRIRQAAQNLSELLDNLLNWAVSQRGELTPRPRPLRATELLADIAALYQSAALAADITFTTATAADLQVYADPDMTRTILRNLAGNALKATPAGGTVALQADRDAAGRVRLRVIDTGPGLTAENLVRLNAATPTLRVASRDSGAGLGLLLSRSFAEAQGGALVLAAAAGGGTEATLTLPVVA